MFKSKFLIDSAWKEVLAKNKGVKDNGLLKTLADIKKLGDDDHDDAQSILDQIQKLAGQLKKSREIAAIPVVGKFLAELTSAAESAVRDTAKAKAEADKAKKAEAEKKAKAEAAKKDDDDDDEDDDASPALLSTKMLPLLRLVLKGEMMHTLVAKSGKQVMVMLSRKPIPPARRKMLADQLGGGSTKYYPGHCSVEAGATTFVLKAEVAGLSKLVKRALLDQTGLRVNKVKCRGDDGDDDDDEGDGDAPPARDEPEKEDGERDVRAAELGTAPEVWLGTRELLEGRISALKKAVRTQLDGEDAAFVKTIDGQLVQIDRILGRLDQRLTDSLIKAREAGNAGDRASELAVSRAILGEYIRYVGSERLIQHIDENPFGVKTELKATLVNSLTQLAKAIG